MFIKQSSAFLLVAVATTYFFCSKAEFLMKPTGPYGVGIRNTFVIHSGICPDPFYEQGVNESDFEKDNPKHCHSVGLHWVYPTDSHVRSTDSYSLPAMKGLLQFIPHLKLPQTTVDSLDSLFKVKTYWSSNQPVSTREKFPLVIFMPGSGVSVPAYHNFLSEISSHGYIILGINSVFANGFTELTNGHLVTPPYEYNDNGRTQSLDDLKWVLEGLNDTSLFQEENELKHQIDFQKMALIGHSMGAMSIANLIQKQNLPNLSSVVLLDPGNVIGEANYPLQLGPVPALVLWSSQFKHVLKGKVDLGLDHYEAVVTSKIGSLEYSNHLDISDLGTLRYHPSMQHPLIQQFLKTPNNLALGSENGKKTTELVRRSTVQFLDSTLKKRKAALDQSSFQNEFCKDFNETLQVVCGRRERDLKR